MSGIISDNVSRSSGLVKSAGGGKVLQCIQYTDDTARSTTAGQWVTASSTLGGVITPSATTSKILCMVNTAIYLTANDAVMTIFRDATNLGDATYGLLYSHVVSSIDQATMIILDSPSTVSEITYQVKCGNNSGGSTFYLGSNTDNGSLVLMEIGA